MSLFAAIDGRYAADVATNSGWSDFIAWAEGKADELTHLVVHGWSDQLGELRSEIKAALNDGNPTADQRSIGEALLSVIYGVEDKAVLVVSDGVGEGESGDTALSESLRGTIEGCQTKGEALAACTELIYRDYP